MSRFFEWTPDDDPGFVVSVPAEWDSIRKRYSPNRNSTPLERVIQLATDHKVQSVVVERRYIDSDYRSEHSRFYSTTFKRYPSVCHRLHFFRSELPDELSGLALVDPGDYVGYSVMRPIPNAPVGRTMITPPRELDGGAVALVEDEVHLWGYTFSVRGVPFISQDAQYMRCAHSALWMMLYHSHLAHGTPRRLPSDIQNAATGGHVLGRQVPSEGLSIGQVLKALHEMNTAGPRIKLPKTREASRTDHRLSLMGVMARYVSSNMPPMIYSENHAWVVVGHKRNPDGGGNPHDSTRLYRHDDARGPYLVVEDPWAEAANAHRTWKGAIPPLPQKVYMTSERAELVGETRLRRQLKRLGEGSFLRETYGEDYDATLTVRTYCMPATAFLAGLDGRVPQEVATLYRLQHWSKWIWVVELLDRQRLYDGEEAVVGEAIIDATASDLSSIGDPVLIARRMWNEVVVYTPDYAKRRRLVVPLSEADYYPSGCEMIRGWMYPYADK